VARKSAVDAVKAEADRYVAKVLSFIREAKAEAPFREIAEARTLSEPGQQAFGGAATSTLGRFQIRAEISRHAGPAA
jgi:hypothetical protein